MDVDNGGGSSKAKGKLKVVQMALFVVDLDNGAASRAVKGAGKATSTVVVLEPMDVDNGEGRSEGTEGGLV
ncbi:hypothetical protein CGCS363_v015110 [Colletotrichum siamense]|uniref:uncharacterized protein n=1 Tax=Colletotrichum siamense TaxID=690259 RepID=UPI0018721A61|nr:uncharacterized protein CGCS363_v015110 [Colletotrichum siamense]KAF5482965.1 hypothetical protein CGCS363_v015110 [Colletotrichum siamense]